MYTINCEPEDISGYKSPRKLKTETHSRLLSERFVEGNIAEREQFNILILAANVLKTS